MVEYEPDLRVGDHVAKEGGDYRFEGVIDCVFRKRSGVTRIVVEDADGVLLIMAPRQVRRIDARP